MDDHAHAQSQRAVNRAHPLRVAPRQVIVHRDDVHAAAGQRIQHGGQCRDQRLAFARLHLRDFALVQHDAADQLHVEVPHAEFPAACLAHQRERGHQRRFQRLLASLLELRIVERKIAETLFHLRSEQRGFLEKLGVTQLFVFRRQSVDRVYQRLNLLEVALVLGADEPGDHPVDHGIDSHHNPFMLSLTMLSKTRCAANSLFGEFVPLRKTYWGLSQTAMSNSAKNVASVG